MLPVVFSLICFFFISVPRYPPCYFVVSLLSSRRFAVSDNLFNSVYYLAFSHGELVLYRAMHFHELYICTLNN